MPTIYLEQKKLPEVPLEAESITPGVLSGKSKKEIRALPLLYGNAKAKIGDFFDVRLSDFGADTHIHIEGDLSKVKYLGDNMDSGLLTISGPVGMHLGRGMTGGEIRVDGEVGGFLGAGMQGGLIQVRGQVGHMAGAAYIGDKQGMSGGCIIIHGSCGNEAGTRMNGGLLIIADGSGDFAGVEMKSGTIVVMGDAGKCAGACMTGGTIVLLRGQELLPTFIYDSAGPLAIPTMFRDVVKALGVKIPDDLEEKQFRRFIGDSNEQGKGEILVCE